MNNIFLHGQSIAGCPFCIGVILMAKDYAESFYKSDSWERTRAAFAASKFYICERCGRPGSIVHHKVYITPANINNPAVTLSWDNLELLCQDCHNREHHAGEVVREGLAFNAEGELIMIGGGEDDWEEKAAAYF